MNETARRWFESRTFRAGDRDVEGLRRAKGNTRVSVVIPARNEAQTVGEIVASIRDAHLQGTGLVDELFVIDSDSIDDTARVAQAAGAEVHSASGIRPEFGWRPGKGEAMWKSLFVATGDIVVFIDADLTTFTPDYVTGLLMPLLLHDDISLVKAFYDRDLAGSARGTSQGGRVTELTARPIINMWWPDLACVVQPLAGEWAARRSLLETLEFPSGYGIELAALLDTYERLGLQSIAQVDLGRRGHVHQDLTSLGALAAEVISAAVARKFGEEESRDSQISHLLRAPDGASDEWVTRVIHSQVRPSYLTMTANASDHSRVEELR